MPNEKTDSLGFATENADQQRDNAAKGGPATGLGRADNRHTAAKPVTEDTQTKITTESKENTEGDVRENN